MDKTVWDDVDVFRTLRIMRDFSNRYAYDLRNLPEQITLGQFYRFVCELPYDSEEDAIGEIIRRPGITMETGGDCDDKAVLIAAFCNRYLRTEIAEHFFKCADYGSGLEHVYNQIHFRDGSKLILDATYSENKFGFEEPYKESILCPI